MNACRNDRLGVVLVALLGVLAMACQTSGTPPMEMAAESTSESPLEALSEAAREPVDTTLGSVYFDLDRSTIRADAESVLRDNAELIQQHESWGTIVIEGHCDERGSEEYNMALGERRAAGVKQYLVDLGVPGRRLRAVSYGESRPAVSGFGEEAYRYNRRSDFTTVETIVSAR